MNISSLTDPNPKPYLDINCHNLRCGIINCDTINTAVITTSDIEADTGVFDQVTTSSLINNNFNDSEFVAFQSSPLTLNNSTQTSSACDTSRISSAHFNLITNVYTAPRNGSYEFSLDCSAINQAAVQLVSVTMTPIINGISRIPRLLNFTTTALSQGNSIGFSDIYNLNTGDTVSYTIANSNAAVNSITISGTTFSGYQLN